MPISSNNTKILAPRLFQRNNLALRLMMLLWPLGLTMIHFGLFRFANFEVTIAVLLCSLIILYLLIPLRTKIKHLFIALGVLIYSLSLGFFAENTIEYFKSLLLLTNLIFIVILSLGMSLPDDKLVDRSVKLFLFLSFVVAVFVILQMITLNIFGNYILMNPFGQFSLPGPGGEIYKPLPTALLKRPNGIFSEPSVVGWFMTFATAVALSSPILCKRTKWFTAFICAVAAVSSLTLTGFLNICMLSLVFLYINRLRGWMRIVINSLVLGLIFIMIFSFFKLGLSKRFDNFYVPGKSAYYRVTAPTLLLLDSLPEHPFGHPLGQTSYIESKDYMVNWEKGSTTNIDNSFLMISFYFGISGVFIFFITLCYLGLLILRRSFASLIVISVVLALCETGAVWSHAFAMIIGYSIILVRFILFCEGSKSRNLKESYT